jgi:CRISPR-associated protein Cst2
MELKQMTNKNKYCWLTILTPHGIAANNRGEGDGGNTTTLQKITIGDEVHTTVSSESIRWGIREYLGNTYPDQVNRIYDPIVDEYSLKDESYDETLYLDDDAFGYMDARKNSKNEDATTKRRGVVEVSRAISTLPYNGDKIFNSRAGIKNSNALYNTEAHYTQYQYSLGFRLGDFIVQDRAKIILDAITNVRHVGGNHSRFMFDFAPESIVIRVTNSPSPSILYGFDADGKIPEIVRLVDVGDIQPGELIIGGKISANKDDAEALDEKGLVVCGGILEAIDTAKYALFRKS